MTESTITAQILEVLAHCPHIQTWRNNIGVARKGRCVIRYGLCVGSGDRIGFIQRKITSAMVGQAFAQFLSIETKREKGGRVSPERQAWFELVNSAGGLAIVASGVKDLEGVV